jgi:opacity protein-like surface antigen
MLKICFAALLALPVMTYAQTSETPVPVGSVTANFVYMFDPSQTYPFHVDVPPGGLVPHDRSLFGWSAVGDVNLLKWAGLQGDFGTLYMRSVYPGQTRITFAAGPKFMLAPHSRATPFVYAEGGMARYAAQYNPVRTWMPVYKAGFGFHYRTSPGFGVTLVPAEYVATYQDNRTWNNSFEAKIGITFHLLANRSYVW